LLSMTPTTAVIQVLCTKGTYIRTLAQDIGRALGCFAHLSALRRTQVGPFFLDGAITLEALQAMEAPERVLIALQDLPAELASAIKSTASSGAVLPGSIHVSPADDVSAQSH